MISPYLNFVTNRSPTDLEEVKKTNSFRVLTNLRCTRVTNLHYKNELLHDNSVTVKAVFFVELEVLKCM